MILLTLLCFCLEVAAILQTVVDGFDFGETQDIGQGEQVNLEYS